MHISWLFRQNTILFNNLLTIKTVATAGQVSTFYAVQFSFLTTLLHSFQSVTIGWLIALFIEPNRIDKNNDFF